MKYQMFRNPISWARVKWASRGGKSFNDRLRARDGRRRIPRPKTSPHLPAHLALLALMQVATMIAFKCLMSFAASYLIFKATLNFQLGSTYSIVGYVLAFLAGCVGPSESGRYIYPYTRLSERTTHGSAQWATPEDMHDFGLARKPGEATEVGDLYLGKLSNGDDFLLPLDQVMSHICVVGPPGSGKSDSIIYNMLVRWATSGAVIVLDPKGELYAKTGMHFKNVYRFDLEDPDLSDRWDFVNACRGNASFAHEVASMILGVGGTKKAEGTTKFWDRSETAALTAVLLHLSEKYENASAAMISELVGSKTIEQLQQEMYSSPSIKARLFWGIFNKAREDTLGSILTGIGVVCQTFMLDNVAAVMAPMSEDEQLAAKKQTALARVGRATQRQARQIDLGDLRTLGTAVFIVVPEGEAARFDVVVSTMLALANSVLRKTSKVRKGAPKPTPALFMFEEAGNLPLYGLKEMLGVGRGRRIGVLTFYQDIPQIYSQYGQEEGGAVLDMYGTKIFLPGLGIASAEYAAKCIGDTTVLKHTSVDGRGSKFDNERYSDVGRRLIDATEIRQIRRFTEALAIVGTAPPIRFVFPERCLLDEEEYFEAPNVGRGKMVTMEEADIIKFLTEEDGLSEAKLLELEEGVNGRPEEEEGAVPDGAPVAAGGLVTGVQALPEAAPQGIPVGMVLSTPPTQGVPARTAPAPRVVTEQPQPAAWDVPAVTAAGLGRGGAGEGGGVSDAVESTRRGRVREVTPPAVNEHNVPGGRGTGVGRTPVTGAVFFDNVSGSFVPEEEDTGTYEEPEHFRERDAMDEIS